jgi:hypothetical protein
MTGTVVRLSGGAVVDCGSLIGRGAFQVRGSIVLRVRPRQERISEKHL